MLILDLDETLVKVSETKPDCAYCPVNVTALTNQSFEICFTCLVGYWKSTSRNVCDSSPRTQRVSI